MVCTLRHSLGFFCQTLGKEYGKDEICELKLNYLSL